MVAVERHLWVIRGMLDDGEEQLTWVKARRMPMHQQGALALTPRRVIFVGMGSFRSAAESFPFPLIGAATLEGGTLRFQVTGETETFTGKAADLGAFLAAFDEARGGAAAVESDSDLPAQLERLTGLHASGALNDEEFAQAKARLLS